MIMDPRTGTPNYLTNHDVKPSYIDAHRLFPGVTTLWRPSQPLVPHGEELDEVRASNGEDFDTFSLLIAQAGGPYHLPQLNEYISSSSNMTNSVHSTSHSTNIVHPQVLSKANDGSRMLDVNCQHEGKAPPTTISMHIPNSLKSGSPFPATSHEYQDELMDVHENPFPGPLPESFRELLLQEGGINAPDPKRASSSDPSSPQDPCSQIHVDTHMAGMRQYYHALQVGMSSHPASCDGSLNQALSAGTIAKQMQKDYSYMEQMSHAARPAAPQGKINGLSSCGASRLSKLKGCDYARGVNKRNVMVESSENSRGHCREGEGIARNSINITMPKNQLGPDEKTCKNNMAMASIEQHILAAARADQKARVQSGGSFSNVICFGQGGAESGQADDEMEVLNLGELQADAFVQLVDQQQQPAALLHAQLHAACKRGNVVGSAGASNAATLALHQYAQVILCERGVGDELRELEGLGILKEPDNGSLQVPFLLRMDGKENLVLLENITSGVVVLGPAAPSDSRPPAWVVSWQRQAGLQAGLLQLANELGNHVRIILNIGSSTLQEGSSIPGADMSTAERFPLGLVDLVTMLEKAINYVKFLQLQLKVLTDDEFWSNAQQMMRHEADYSSMFEKGVIAEGNSSLESSSVLSK
ncbi:hypothetical protein L7F22_013641 [Adiantum nelumboides]|nr:hypothetical protein [Adiantum nelumboides]